MSNVEEQHRPVNSLHSPKVFRRVMENGHDVYPSPSHQRFEAKVKEIAQQMVDYLLDSIIVDEVFVEHREASLLSRFGDLPYSDPEKSPVRKQYEVNCPECHRTIAAIRFAPHLDKCIGKGRNSSRVARQKLQQGVQDGTQSSSNSHSEDEMLLSNDDDDVDWRKRKRRGGRLGKKGKRLRVEGAEG